MGIDADIVINVGDADIIIVYTTSEKKICLYEKIDRERTCSRFGLVWLVCDLVWFSLGWMDGWIG